VHSDEEAAALYGVLDAWGSCNDFYLALVMAARSVLDVGCGTGALLHRARRAGHGGRLCGLDPDRARLGVARRSTDFDWVAGTAASMTWDGEFDLAVMTGRAFQELIGDDEVRASLAAIHRALADGGRLAFETRNPLARAWEHRNPGNAVGVADQAGRPVRVWHEVESVVGDVVTLTETTGDPDGTPSRGGPCQPALPGRRGARGLPRGAGFQIEAQYGGWGREPLEPASPEIITLPRAERPARRPS
jgi:SAM-dependent methyltransferase